MAAQGAQSVSIGVFAGSTSQTANSIIINASGGHLSSSGVAGTFISPIRFANAGGFTTTPYLLMYDISRKEITYSTASTTQGKTFVIDHPLRDDKYLVHACVESPNTELVYRGAAILVNKVCKVKIPEYASYIGYNWTIKVQSIGKTYIELTTTEIVGREFTVYGNIDGKFYWCVYGQRTIFNPEPNKSDVKVKGDGPYKWI